MSVLLLTSGSPDNLLLQTGDNLLLVQDVAATADAGGNTILRTAPAVTLLAVMLAGGNTITRTAPNTVGTVQADAGANTITRTAPAVTGTTRQTVDAGGNRLHRTAPAVALRYHEPAGVATRQAPDVWIALTVVRSGSPDTVTYRWSTRALADPPSYYGGFKAARVVSGGWGDVSRSLSSIDGQYQVATWSVELDDTDGAIRALLEDDEAQHELRWEGAVYLVSETGRKAGVTPRTLIRVRVTKAIPIAGRRVRLECKDLLGADLKGFDLDAYLPVPLLVEDWGDLRGFPEALKEQVAPLVVGQNSDAGAVDEHGESVEKGLVPVYYVGDTWIGDPGSEPDGPQTLPEPTGLSATVIGTPGNTTRTYGVTWVSIFGETTAATITVENTPDTLDASNYVRLTWNNVPASLEDETRHARVFGRDTAGLVTWLAEVDGTSYDDTGADTPKPGAPPVINGAQTAPGGAQPGTGGMYWRTFVVAYGVLDLSSAVLFAADGFGAGQTKRRANLGSADAPAGVWNVDFLRPGGTEWPHDNNWVERNGHRYTVIYGRGPRADAHVNGEVAIALNVCGYRQHANGTGNVIDQAFYAAQHVLSEFGGLAHGGVIYGDEDDWLGVPRGADGAPKLQSSAFARCQAQSAARMGTAKGYLARFVINERVTLRWFLEQCAISFNCFWRVNHHGQLGPVLIDHAANPLDGPLYRDRIEIKRWHTPEIDDDVCNRLRAIFDWDAERGAWRVAEEVFEDETLVKPYGGWRERRERLELRLVGDEATYRNVVAHWFDLYKRKRRFLSFDVRLQGLQNDLGDPLRVTHYDGKGRTGDQATRTMVWSHVVLLNQDTVRLTVLDISKLTPQETAA